MRKLFVFLTICLVVGGIIGTWLVFSGYQEGQKEYEGLKQDYVRVVGCGETLEQIQTVESGLPGTIGNNEEIENALCFLSDAPSPSVIDFSGLKERNHEVVAWIEIPAIEISYPILQAADNEYYLHRDIDRNDLFAGSIFLDCNNNPELQDRNTIIYGHNMRDGSMFARLSDLQSPDRLNECRYFWIHTERESILYQIFSIHRVLNESTSYQISFANDQEYREWIQEMKMNSTLDCFIKEIDFEQMKDKAATVTLSTCTENNLEKQVVQGLRIVSIPAALKEDVSSH